MSRSSSDISSSRIDIASSVKSNDNGLSPELVSLVDQCEVKSKKYHRTWAGTFQCKPSRYFQPSTIEEIKAIVSLASKTKARIMAVGSGHSPSDLTMGHPAKSLPSTFSPSATGLNSWVSSEWYVNLDKFNKPIKLESYKNEPKETALYTDVTVEAGIRIYQINEYLKENGLALQNLGSISEQSIAGIISTGTHGSSAYHGLVSQQIVDLTVLVASTGKLVKCSETENTDLFRAALLSLGKIGLIVYATIRAIPKFTIHSVQEVIAFDKFLGEVPIDPSKPADDPVNQLWENFWTSSEYLRVWWYPYSNRCILWRANKSTAPLSKPRESWYGTTLGRLFYQSLLWIAVKIWPSCTPMIEKFVFDKQYGLTETYRIPNELESSATKADEAVQESVEGLNMDCLFSQFVDEWGVPLKTGKETLFKLREKIFAAAKNGTYYVHVPIEVRCSNLTTVANVSDSPETTKMLISNAENSSDKPHVGAIPGNSLAPFLNPAPNGIEYAAPIPGKVSNKNLTLYINATMYRPFGFNSPIDKWFREFEDIVDGAGGKPHWAKNFLGREEPGYIAPTDGQMRGLSKQVDEWFGKDLKAWKDTRAKYDPENVFLSGETWAKVNGLL